MVSLDGDLVIGVDEKCIFSPDICPHMNPDYVSVVSCGLCNVFVN